MKYHILFIGYWNLDDPLTESTIIPHLKILSEMDQVKSLSFLNTQREPPSQAKKDLLLKLGVAYFPLFSKNFKPNLINKLYDFIKFPHQIKKLLKKSNYNFIVARGAPAGALAYLATKNIKIPYIVESFEPHADYMYYSNTWKMYDPRYIFQKYWEKRQWQTASALITVSYNYREELLKEGVNEKKLFVAPCAIDTEKFYPDSQIKKQIREELKIPLSAVVGIYAGKFGGIYLEEKAFEIFKACFDELNCFHLVLLSNQNMNWIKKMLSLYNIPQERVHQHFVPYNKVNLYLNCANFGFALYKSTKVSPYLSPIKIGEYWACGLPVLMTKNVGDEFLIIEKEQMGFLYDNYEKINFLRLINFDTQLIQNKVKKFRNFSQIKEIYNKVIN
ncbi:hypothetical protein C9994_06415 [Marivirga lumbricoides]|uniref:Glycosyltransferase subfamily 4-like N-terminal domain-containing protein n=1 Tax=Marivirga lumbricoides TaxID=1046115 RepID=A0A2T4DSD4_9BACT|nr:hypothetical protein C9994_06415 [Marivirga lumbricoides]